MNEKFIELTEILWPEKGSTEFKYRTITVSVDKIKYFGGCELKLSAPLEIACKIFRGEIPKQYYREVGKKICTTIYFTDDTEVNVKETEQEINKILEMPSDWEKSESYTKRDVDDAYLKGVTNTKNEIEKKYEANYQIRKDIATFIFNYKGDIKDRAKWMDYLGIKVSFAEKQAEQKSIEKIVVPIFHIGNTIIKKHNSDINDFGSFTITNITGGKYWYKDRIICDITKQDEWELYEPVRQKSAEWSEEDESKIKGIINTLEGLCDSAASDTTKDLYIAKIDWLKSFKGRYSWKPSEEEMKALADALSLANNCGEESAFDLRTLYKQLKKLKGE